MRKFKYYPKYRPYKPDKYPLLELLRRNGLSDRCYWELVREIRYKEEQAYLKKLHKQKQVQE